MRIIPFACALDNLHILPRQRRPDQITTHSLLLHLSQVVLSVILLSTFSIRNYFLSTTVSMFDYQSLPSIFYFFVAIEIDIDPVLQVIEQCMKLSNASFPSSAFAMSALYSMYSSYRAIKDGIFKCLVVISIFKREQRCLCSIVT